MTQDDILRMAREVGLLAGADLTSDRNRLFTAGLERFAALVEAAEREACAKVCEALCSPSRLSDPGRSWITGTTDCAAAIRARSTQ